MHDIGGAAAQAARDQRRMRREVGGDAGIHHAQPRTVRARQHADRGTAGKKIGDHLRGYGLRKCGHALCSNAVVGGEHQRLGMRDRRCEPLLHARDPRRQPFEFTQCAERFGFRVEFGVHRARERIVGGDRCDLRRYEISRGCHRAVVIVHSSS